MKWFGLNWTISFGLDTTTSFRPNEMVWLLVNQRFVQELDRNIILFNRLGAESNRHYKNEKIFFTRTIHANFSAYGSPEKVS